MKRFFFVICFLTQSAVSFLFAQDFAPLSIEYTPLQGGDFAGQSFQAAIAVPIVRQEKWMFAFSPGYKYQELVQHDFVTDPSLQELSSRMMLQYKTSRNTRWQWIVSPSFSNPFSHRSGWTFNSALIFSKANPVFSYSLGLAYSHRYKNNFLIPIFRLHWKPVEKWTFSGRIPMNLDVQYSPTLNWRCGAEISNNTISGESRNDRYDWLSVREKSLAFYANRKLFGNWWLCPSAGYTFSRQIRSYTLPEHDSWSISGNFGQIKSDIVDEANERGAFLKVGFKYTLEY
jgi:hypothetical protein